MIHTAPKKIFAISAVLAISGLFASSSMAQAIHNTSGSIALGGGGGAYVNGYHANFVNPANLMIPDRSTRYTIGFIGGIQTTAGGSLLNTGLYNRHFTKGNVIDTELALRISDEWFGSGSEAATQMGLGLDVVPLGVSYRRDDMAFSIAARARTLGSAGMSKGMFDMALTGLNTQVFNEPKRINFDTEVLAMWELSFGFAMEAWRNQEHFAPGFMRVFAGVAPKILFGSGYAKMGLKSQLQVTGREQESRIVHNFNYYIHTVGNLTNGFNDYYQERRVIGNKDVLLDDFFDDDTFSDLGRLAGMGLGLDLGGTFEWYIDDVSLPVIGSGPRILRASLSITDIGGINFRKNPGDFRADDVFIWEGLSIDFEYIDEEHDGKFSNYLDYVIEDSIGSDIYGNFAPREVKNHSVGLTPVVNIGGALSMGRLSVMLDVGKGTNNRSINSRRLYSALGTEYRIAEVVPVRVGMRLGGNSSMNLSAGTGIDLKNFEFTIGVMSTPSSSRGGMNLSAAWSGLIVRF